MAQGLDLLMEYKNAATAENPLPQASHNELVEQLRSFYLVGGMPAAVDEWILTKSYLEVSRVHREIIDSYNDDFSKYKKRISPLLLRQTLRSVAQQVGSKFVCSEVTDDVKSTMIKEALRLLSLAGLIVPVVHTTANGLPLGAGEDVRYTKYLFFDLGVMQTLLDMPAAEILLANDIDFVNKGGASEMFAGLEMMKYGDCYMKAEMHYWQNASKASQAEVDYVASRNGKVLPIEVKASTQGSMQSLWIFMREHHLHDAVRTSLENFGQFYYYDPKDNDSERQVDIIPLYSLINVNKNQL